jgi:hypothetical protein
MNKSLYRFLVLGGVGLALLAGCTNVPYVTHDVITTQSCTAGAKAVRFLVGYSDPFVTSIDVQPGSSNIVGVPGIVDTGFGFEVTAELNNVGLGEQVIILFNAVALRPFALAVSDVQYFTVPPDQIVDPGCNAGVSPEIALIETTAQHLVLQISNPSTHVVTLETLQLAGSPIHLDPPMLDWSGSSFNALPWQSPLQTPTVLDPALPPVEFELPSSMDLTWKSLYLRFVCSTHFADLRTGTSFQTSIEMRGITEVDVVGGPVATQSTTWGAVKALYRRE